MLTKKRDSTVIINLTETTFDSVNTLIPKLNVTGFTRIFYLLGSCESYDEDKALVSFAAETVRIMRLRGYQYFDVKPLPSESTPQLMRLSPALKAKGLTLKSALLLEFPETVTVPIQKLTVLKEYGRSLTLRDELLAKQTGKKVMRLPPLRLKYMAVNDVSDYRPKLKIHLGRYRARNKL